jgi:hypothetical protein
VIEQLKETTMLKKISAALIAISMLAAPAMAAGSSKTSTAPIIKPVAAAKVQAPAASLKVKPSVLNANAKMGRHHHRHVRHHHARKHFGAIKTHKVAKVTVKHIGSATKRG